MHLSALMRVLMISLILRVSSSVVGSNLIKMSLEEHITGADDGQNILQAYSFIKKNKKAVLLAKGVMKIGAEFRSRNAFET